VQVLIDHQTTNLGVVGSNLARCANAVSTATAHSHKKKGLEIVHPWTRVTESKDITSIAVFMTIKNRGAGPDRLISASSPIAVKVELHGSPDMAPTGGGKFPIPAGKMLELKRDGPHLMLSGLSKQLDAYQDFKMTLVFEKAGRLQVDVMVEEAAPEAPHKH
jgi:periplasmic copper chaperone A